MNMNHMIKSINRSSGLKKQVLYNLIRSAYYSTVAADNIISPTNSEDTAGFGFTAEDLLNAKPFEDIPSPKTYPFVGNFLSFKPFGDLDAFDRIQCCTELQKQHGDIVKLSIPFVSFMKNVVEIMDPHDFEIVYRNEGRNPKRATNVVFEKYRKEREQGLGLFLSNGDEWWKFRKPLNPAMMKANAAKPYLSVQDPIGDELVSNLKKALSQTEDNVHPMIMTDIFRYALEAVCAIVFDRRLGCMDMQLPVDSWQQQFISSVHKAFQHSVSLNLNPRYKLLNSIGYKAKKQREFEESMDFITDTSLKLVQQSKDEWNNIPEAELRKKFLPQLLNIPNLSMMHKVTLIFDMLLAAIDTTTYTTINICFYLATNPEIQEKLYAEINEHVQDGALRQPETIEKLAYLRACIKESHRMKPIAFIISREVPHDIVIKGYRIPAGTTVLLEQQYVANSSKFVDNPESFNPDRWIRSKGKNVEKLNPFLIRPFGFGPRMCIGKRFAEQELNVAIIKLVKNFRIEFDGDKLPLKGIGLDKVPVKLNFRFYER